jgi:hypothetical protein
MTGEISLRSAEIRTVILPARNRRDLEYIPESVRTRLEFVWAEKIDDVLARALEAVSAQRAAAANPSSQRPSVRDRACCKSRYDPRSGESHKVTQNV